MADLKTKVELSLKDGFSSSIKKSGDAAEQFGKKASGAFQGVDKALSGISGTLATIGVAMGTAALV